VRMFELAAIDAHRATVAAADLECWFDGCCATSAAGPVRNT
jgi:hypothetical protein